MQVRTCVAWTHSQELRQILTHNPKGLPIVFLYSLWDGRNTWPSSVQRCAQGMLQTSVSLRGIFAWSCALRIEHHVYIDKNDSPGDDILSKYSMSLCAIVEIPWTWLIPPTEFSLAKKNMQQKVSFWFKGSIHSNNPMKDSQNNFFFQKGSPETLIKLKMVKTLHLYFYSISKCHQSFFERVAIVIDW